MKIVWSVVGSIILIGGIAAGVMFYVKPKSEGGEGADYEAMEGGNRGDKNQEGDNESLLGRSESTAYRTQYNN